MANNFPPTSRYYNIETVTLETPEGKILIYQRRRLLPLSEGFSLLFEHVVVQNERLDNITARHLGDPEQFWRVCDGNNAMIPDELTETLRRRLRITLPGEIPNL